MSASAYKAWQEHVANTNTPLPFTEFTKQLAESGAREARPSSQQVAP